jgi:hypothetical protein
MGRKSPQHKSTPKKTRVSALSAAQFVLSPNVRPISPASDKEEDSKEDVFNEERVKEMIIKDIWNENVQKIKSDEHQKSLEVSNQRLLDYLEDQTINFRFCRLCDSIIPDDVPNECHLNLKSHKNKRDELNIKDTEDLELSIVVFCSCPGDIEKELIKEKEKALKRKCYRIKQ